jgi:predicted neutral ceramidase superfamily lipid hydrolase
MGPSDPIVGLNESFALDSSPTKVNVGVGAYRGNDGLPYILPCVREAEKINMAKRNVPINTIRNSVAVIPENMVNYRVKTKLSYVYTIGTFTQNYFTLDDIFTAIGGFFALVQMVLGYTAVFGVIYYFYSFVKVVKKKWILSKHMKVLQIMRANLSALDAKMNMCLSNA